MDKMILLFFIVMFSACSNTPINQAHQNDSKSLHMNSPRPLEVLSSLKRNPKSKIIYKNGWTVIQLGTSIWSFTPNDHHNYPSAIKRTIVIREGRLQYQTKILCRDFDEDCSTLVDEFEAISISNKQQTAKHE